MTESSGRSALRAATVTARQAKTLRDLVSSSTGNYQRFRVRSDFGQRQVKEMDRTLVSKRALTPLPPCTRYSRITRVHFAQCWDRGQLGSFGSTPWIHGTISRLALDSRCHRFISVHVSERTFTPECPLPINLVVAFNLFYYLVKRTGGSWLHGCRTGHRPWDFFHVRCCSA